MLHPEGNCLSNAVKSNQIAISAATLASFLFPDIEI